jgi:hypothetical protein
MRRREPRPQRWWAMQHPLGLSSAIFRSQRHRQKRLTTSPRADELMLDRYTKSIRSFCCSRSGLIKSDSVAAPVVGKMAGSIPANCQRPRMPRPLMPRSDGPMMTSRFAHGYYVQREPSCIARSMTEIASHSMHKSHLYALDAGGGVFLSVPHLSVLHTQTQCISRAALESCA